MVFCLSCDAAAQAEIGQTEEGSEETVNRLSKPYRVEMFAPSEVEDYLEDYLDVFRARKRKDLTLEDLYLLTDRAPDNVTELLKTLGYFSAQADSRLDDEGDQYAVFLAVVPGERIMVQSVDVRIRGEIEHDEAMMQRTQNALRWLWRLPKGEPFTQAGWDESKQRVHDYISSRSYPTARTTYSKATIDQEKHTAALEIEIVSGPPYVFGDVTLSGFERYPEKVVRDRITIEPGAPYRQNAVRNMQTDLQNLPYFNGVVVEAPPSENEPYVVPVDIRVEEAPRNKLDLSLGYSTNDGVRVVSKYAFYNVASRGWIFDSMLDISEDKQGGELALQFPRRPDGYEHRLFASYNDSEIQGWTSRVGRAGIMRSKSKNRIDRTFVLEHVMEKRHNDFGRSDDLQATPFTFRWIRHTVVPRNNPRRGYVIQGEASAALKGVGSDESFVRLYGRGIHYWPIGQKHVALVRLEAGQTFTEKPEDVPTDYLFRVGGSGSVRGYDYLSLGIEDHTSRIPGRVMATGTVEYQHTIIKDWRLALFADYGDAANRWGDWDGKTGVGTGARWISPVGSIGADIAYGIDEEIWRFYFSLGMSF
jgi:Outer membrane protein